MPHRTLSETTVRNLVGVLLTGAVVAALIGLDDQRLIAGQPSVIQATGAWHPTVRELCALLFLGSVTIGSPRIRRAIKADLSRAPRRAQPVSIRRSVRVAAAPVRVLELRSVSGTGGGPEKTILLGARPDRESHARVTACYIRDERDSAFNIHQRAAGLEIDYVEIVERHSFDPRVWAQLKHLIRDRQIDIVHSHDYKTNLLAFAAGRLGLVTPLSTAHGWNPSTLRETAVYYPADKRLLARFPHVIAVSSAIRDELVRCGAQPDRVSVILNGIDPKAFTRRRADEGVVRTRLGIRPDQFVVGAIGRLAVEKDFGSLLHAFASLRHQFQNLVLLIVGEGPEREALQRLASELQLGEACRFLGQHPNIVEIHHALDLFVQSSLTEGTPNVVLEAMAMETPIVATAAGGTEELVENGVHALIVPAGDREALAQAMKTVLVDRSAARARAVLARARIETDLSFEGRRRAVEAIYDRLLTQHRS